MEKLPMCRMCLVDNVPMFRMVNRNLHDLYEKLTDNPFVTDDCRPMLACSFCYAKLKQCYRLLIQCLEAEERFAQRMNEDYKDDYLINQDLSGFFCGFSKSPIELISIFDECRTESIAAKVELPTVSEILDDIIEPKEEYQSEELEPETLDNSCLDVGHIPPLHSESDSEDDERLVEFKIEVEEHEVTETIQRARNTIRTTVRKKPKVEPRKIKLEGAITAEQTKKQKLDSKIIHTALKRSPKSDTYLKERYIHPGSQMGEKRYKCSVCQRSFKYKYHLLEHIRIHTGEKPYKCNVCERNFRQIGALTRHMRTHTGGKPSKCDICQLSFKHKTSLTKHIRIHTGEEPYKCNVCERSFIRTSALTEHIRTHTGQKPYQCDICHFSFKHKTSLTKHIRIHTGEKPYKCNVCESSFNQISGLTRHIRIHTGEKPYKCNVCERSFSESGALTRHMRTHTGGKQ